MRNIKCLKSDIGTKYTNSKFMELCERHGIKRHFTVRKTPQQNIIAKRMNIIIIEKARCLRMNAGLAKNF
jgi:transposase InsO family protein